MTAASASPIFDVHQHFGLVPGRTGAGDDPGDVLANDCRLRIAFMEQFGIERAAIMPGHFYSAPGGIADIRALNDGVHVYGRLAPERFVALFGTLDPRHGSANLAEIDRLGALGFRGVSWHHRFQGLPIDHPVMFAIAERMAQHGMVAMMHCYAQGDFEAPWRLRRLAEHFPEMTFVGLDAMTSPENLEQFLAITERLDNVYFDMTTTLLGPRGVRLTVERGGVERLLFGSNYYSMSTMPHIAALTALEAAGLDPAQARAILFDNACRVMGIGAAA
jgi:predicted TIM-barrel fold metal-dependent hydrolase